MDFLVLEVSGIVTDIVLNKFRENDMLIAFIFLLQNKAMINVERSKNNID